MNHAAEKTGEKKKKRARSLELMMNRRRGGYPRELRQRGKTHRPASVNGACLFYSSVIIFLANTARAIKVVSQNQLGLFLNFRRKHSIMK